MKDFSKNKAALNSYPQQFAGIFSADPEIADFLQNPQTLGEITDRLTAISQNKPDVTSIQRLNARIDALDTAFRALKNSINPERSENERRQSAANFTTAFNTVTDKMDDKTFRDDIAELLNTVGHEMQDDPFIQFLRKIETACFDVQDLSDDLICREITGKINSDFGKNNAEWEKLQQDRKNAIGAMYKINPELRISELDGVLRNTERSIEKAQFNFDNFNSPISKEGREKIRIEATTRFNMLLKQVEEEKATVKNNREQAQVLKSGGAYSLDSLQETNLKWIEYDEANVIEEKAIQRKEKELDEVLNSTEKLSEAEKKIKAATAERDKLLVEIDPNEDYKAWLKIKKYENNAFTASELLSDLIKAQEDGLLYPALIENGVISGIPGMAVKPRPQDKDNLNTQAIGYLEKKKIAEKYLKMRSCIIEATKDPFAEKTKGKTEAEIFFETIENSRDQYKPMKLIEEKFAVKCKEIYEDAISSDYAMVNRNAELFTDEKLRELQDRVTTAEDELDQLKNRLASSRKADVIREDIKDSKERIAFRNEEKLYKSNGYLEEFGEEPQDKPLSIGELGAIGTKKIAQLLSEIEILDSPEHKFNNERELSKLRNKIAENSVENEKKTSDEINAKLEKAKAQKEVVTGLQKTCNSLRGRHNEIADKQGNLKEKTAIATHHIPLDNTASALAAIGRHIEDATRFVSHKNSGAFTAMTGTLLTAINSINDPAVQDNVRIHNIELLKQAAEDYLAAKRAQTFVLGTAMRKSRMDYATQIVNITTKALNRSTALMTSEEWQTANNNLSQKEIEHSSEGQFKRDFELSQEEFKLQKQSEELNNSKQEINLSM